MRSSLVIQKHKYKPKISLLQKRRNESRNTKTNTGELRALQKAIEINNKFRTNIIF